MMQDTKSLPRMYERLDGGTHCRIMEFHNPILADYYGLLVRSPCQSVKSYSVDQKFFTFRDFLQINSITSILGRAVLKYSDIALRICTIVA